MARSNVTKMSFAKAARKLEEYYAGLGKPIASGLRQIGEEIIADVRVSRPGRGVPRDEGALASTLDVEQPASNVVLLVAGGPAAEYAIVQHERMDYHHDVGEARYLVRGAERWKPDGSAAIAALSDQAAALAERLGKKA